MARHLATCLNDHLAGAVEPFRLEAGRAAFTSG